MKRRLKKRTIKRIIDKRFITRKITRLLRYEKTILFKYIDIKDTALYNSFWISGFISREKQLLSKFNPYVWGDAYEEINRFYDFLENVGSRRIEKSDDNKEIIKIRFYLYLLYDLYKDEVYLYRLILKGDANPGKLQTERKACLSAPPKAEKIKVTIQRGAIQKVESYKSTKYFPMPLIIMKRAFIPAIKKSLIAKRFDTIDNEMSELIFYNGIVFETLKEIIIESLDKYTRFADKKQGGSDRSSFINDIMKRFTALHYFIKDCDLYIQGEKCPTTERDFICKFLNIDIPESKFQNFRGWNKNHKTEFPNPKLPKDTKLDPIFIYYPGM